MTDTGIWASSAHVIQKCGAGASTSGASVVYSDSFLEQAESYINCITRYNWTDKWATLNTDVKMILREASSNLAAIYAINFNMAGYSSKEEAELMMNVLKKRFDECIEVLIDQKSETYMLGA